MKRLAMLGVLGMLLTAPAFAAGTSDGYGSGGLPSDYLPIIEKYNASGELFIIRGLCRSSCTLFLTIRNSCIASDARFGFHAARVATNTSRMLNSYHASLRSHLESVGAMQSANFYWISARDMVAKYGYRACPRR